MKYIMISLLFFSIISCDDKLTQSDCERITDQETCGEKGCHWGSGMVVYSPCGGECIFGQNSEGISMCFLSDTGIEEQVDATYHRKVGDQYQIVNLNSNIGNLTGWERGTPECVTCTWDY